MTEQAALLNRLTSVVAATRMQAPLPLRLCLALTEILGFDGGTMTIGFDAPTRTTLCATDERAERIEELQDVLREGPGLDAFRLGEVVDTGPAGIAGRWPMLAEGMPSSSLQLIAAPMRPDTEVLGVLTLYRAAPGRPAADPADVQFLANAIGIAVLGDVERGDVNQEPWSTRDLLNQATGMVVAQLRISPADALAVLRAHAFAQGAGMRQIAGDVVNRTLDFKPTARGEAGEHDDV